MYLKSLHASAKEQTQGSTLDWVQGPVDTDRRKELGARV